MLKPLLDKAIVDSLEIIPKLAAMESALQRLCDAMKSCWANHKKVLIAGNGGSSADAMHFAEELTVRFMKNRKALAAIALCDPTAITCAGNDYGFDHIFSRQIEALGNAGDILIVLSTSGNSANIIRAIEYAKARKMITCAMLGKDGGKAKGMSDIEMIIPAQVPHRIQEGQKILYHTVCEWVDLEVD